MLNNHPAKNLKWMIFDVDGVLTDGSLYLSDSGEEFKAFNTLDGHGMKMLKASGVGLAIISGRKSNCVALRAKNLAIDYLYQGVENKLDALYHLLQVIQCDPSEVGYMGDDLVDLPVMKRCGFAVTVPDAPDLVKQYAHYVTVLAGGRGAVREVCELVMHVQNTFEQQVACFLA